MSETNANAIKVGHLTKSYGNFTLRDVNLCLPTGSIMGLVGENGAGKTTLFKLIMNVLERDEGKICVLGHDNLSPEFGDLRNDIGVVLSGAGLPEYLSPRQVNGILRQTFRGWNEAYFRQLMADFKLPENKTIKEFSTGMKMKLAIAAALAHNPRLLLLDEPTSGLDPMTREDILAVFNDFTRNPANSILISSHIVSDLEKICDYIAFLHEGRLLFCEEKDRLLEDYALIKMPAADFAVVPPGAVVSLRREAYGVEALVKKHDINPSFVTEHTTLEDIILFWSKGGGAQ